MKKYGWISLMLCVLLLLGGCAKEQEAAVQPPEFRLTRRLKEENGVSLPRRKRSC